ncbi:PEPxxWA-CTERM sorting domain-containing protein [Sphingomonas sp. ID1715]|uniref:PEPxxWA-CTERM sorting domain-containing protein n=1 Tax=Sphingomonas sp. ID1715 TaxID=1656898 RepID=UPI0020C5A2BE|nr:PEPxxWA-CTERM sorting domain-containing protein [Sphingomonas sp. ID1715]
MRSLALAALLVAAPAQSALVKLTYTGHVYHLTDTVSNRFALGDMVSGFVVYETEGVAQPNNTYFLSYYGLVKSGELNVDGYKVTWGAGTRLTTSDGEPAYGTKLIDRFIVDAFEGGDALNGLPFRDGFLNWQDNEGQSIRGGDLPITQAHIDSYRDGVRGAIDWGLSNDAANRVTFELTRVTLSPAVPEPATWALMISGFGLLGATARRRLSLPSRV